MHFSSSHLNSVIRKEMTTTNAFSNTTCPVIHNLLLRECMWQNNCTVKFFTQRHGKSEIPETLAKNITPACRTWCQWSLNAVKSAVNLNIWSYKNKQIPDSHQRSPFAISHHVISKYFSAKNWNRELHRALCVKLVWLSNRSRIPHFLSTWAGCHFCSSALAVIRTTIANAVQN